ncbi:VOC family protein [Psychromonas sp. KJ10-10]|uniref:VOC family protein n=1 Tax=Psychromonas sp. KJ10-10 TaxID=3391823 RepID=UPI0039B4771E
MLLGVSLGTNNLANSGQFYDKLLDVIDMERKMQTADEIGWGTLGQDTQFWVLTPFNKKSATVGNGVQVTFAATSVEKVNQFYETALKLGGVDEGAPGYRYRPHYYGAYVRDLDGNKLHIMHESSDI